MLLTHDLLIDQIKFLSEELDAGSDFIELQAREWIDSVTAMVTMFFRRNPIISARLPAEECQFYTSPRSAMKALQGLDSTNCVTYLHIAIQVNA